MKPHQKEIGVFFKINKRFFCDTGYEFFHLPNEYLVAAYQNVLTIENFFFNEKKLQRGFFHSLRGK